MLPSAVRYLEGGRRQIGEEALANRHIDPTNTIVSVKRFMGRGLKDIKNLDDIPLDLIDKPGMLAIKTCDGEKSPVEISAEILATLRYTAQDTFDDDIYGAVITVPAYFDDAQRQATKDAAKLAGLNVLRLINEPTAAAIAYGLENKSEGTFAVFDLGGGTFDISILHLTKGVFEVLATGGDSHLGGDDFDHALMTWVLDHHTTNALLSDSDKALLLSQARKVKEKLSTNDEFLFDVDLSGQKLQVTVTKVQFQEITKALVDRAMGSVKKALRDASLKVSDIQGVVMVGGSTRMPHIQLAVKEFFKQEPLINLNPDEVVAIGAAIQAEQLAGNASGDSLLLLDVIPLSLGIETMGGLVERIVPRNQTIPTAMAQDFTTYKDGQTALSLHVVQGERDMVADCRSLARFELKGIPPMVAGAARIRVTFTVDADGLLSVEAKELQSEVVAKIEVKPSYGLSDDEIARMLQDGFATAEVDKSARALAEARVDADRMILATQSALDADSDLLSSAELSKIQALITQIQNELSSTDHAVLASLTDALAHETEHFAAKRMNRGIQKALSGKKIESL
jgi:molecular chaperone HscA